ncbi:hypothetical protein IN07_20285 [Modestobacter caceresii]|uniref:STAS domain-containing protein n=1 Tax=Modestobacter caceresii TaxID=1522368 RepID=A0A098Y216_9ACTN|nr:hypothetical protein IN07_20285 [Modestobacter caceresii]
MLQSNRNHWTVDVAELTVGDHAGVRALGGAYRRAVGHGRRVTLLGASPVLRRALQRLDVDERGSQASEALSA